MTRVDEARETRAERIGRLNSTLALTDRHLGGLEDRIGEAGAVLDQYRPLVTGLRSARESLGRMVADVAGESEDAWRVIAHQCEPALDHVQGELATLRSEITAQLAEARPALAHAAAEQVEAWRGRIEALRRQPEPGETAAREAFADALRRVDRAYGALCQRAQVVRDETMHSVEETRSTLGIASREVRRAFERAASLVEKEATP